jgi:cytidyltransferase-like protein
MKIKVGLIVEFNPFHNGHINYINKVKELFPEGVLIAAMSGDVVQRGELSIDSFTSRKEAGIKHGIDVVLEIPPYYTLNNANIFARGAIEQLHKFGVSDIVFGSEINNIEELQRLSEIVLSDGFDEKVLSRVKEIQSYPKAFEEVLGVKLNSNDILGLAYIVEGKKIDPKIKFHSILRDDVNYLSATKIRAMILEDKDVSSYMPYKVLNPINMDDYMYLFRMKLNMPLNAATDEVKYLSKKIKGYHGDS